MLILSRDKDEVIDIKLDHETLTRLLAEREPSIVITIVDVRGQRVRVGFDAPKCVAIHRREVQRRVDAEGRR